MLCRVLFPLYCKSFASHKETLRARLLFTPTGKFSLNQQPKIISSRLLPLQPAYLVFCLFCRSEGRDFIAESSDFGLETNALLELPHITINGTHMQNLGPSCICHDLEFTLVGVESTERLTTHN